MFIFLTARATKRVLRVLEKRETSAAKAAPIERLGSKRNQYGDRLLRLVHV